MFNTIKTWVHRIRNYEQLKSDIEVISEGIQLLNDQNNHYLKKTIKQYNTIKRTQKEVRVLKRKLNENEGYRKNLYSMATILSEGTWKEGDNMMEAIETAQERKYLKEHGEDFLIIMNGNVPEIAARELFEYFEVEVPESNIEQQTAIKLWYLWCRAQEEAILQLGKNPGAFPKYEYLPDRTKARLLEEVQKLWYIP